MIFKDREEAAEKLLSLVKKDLLIKKDIGTLNVVSLLRGGVIFGKTLAKGLKTPHFPLVVTKISAPYNRELAIGALCFDMVYLEERVVKTLQLSKREVSAQIKEAEKKFKDYCQRFGVKKSHFAKLKNKTVVLVDDGIATGATFRAAALFVKSQSAKRVILAAPVVPKDFDARGFDKAIILYKAGSFSAVSQFYANFPQMEDEAVKKLLNG